MAIDYSEYHTVLPTPRTLLSLRTSKMKQLGALNTMSGIDKQERQGRIHVSMTGLTDDEHDLTFHGGPDKALHQYCSDHYPLWQAMYTSPETQQRFIPGGFGENLVVEGLSETNICIGDVVRIGPANSTATGGTNGVLLEVSLPRQPCFKLNQRFGIKNFSGKTHELNRTGWYYRVLEEGYIEAGMEVRVLERRHPKWTIAKIHHHLHRDVTNRAELEEGMAIEQMGNEAKGYFRRCLAQLDKAEAEAALRRQPEVWAPYRVTRKHLETPRTLLLQLTRVDPVAEDDAGVEEASHVRLKLPIATSTGEEMIRSYSIVSGTKNEFTLGIALEPRSRGGSSYLHSPNLQEGDTLRVGRFTCSIPDSNNSASHHLMIAGGIGITAFLALAEALESINYSYELHYGVRSLDDIAFKAALDKMGKKCHLYDRSKDQRMDVRWILQSRKWNSFVYVCGPARLMDDVQACAEELGVPEEEVHYEAFEGLIGGNAFSVRVLGGQTSVDGQGGESTNGKEKAEHEKGKQKVEVDAGEQKEGRLLQVKEDQSLLQVLKDAGFEVDSSCEVGTCGTCRVRHVCGEVEHRGRALRTEEQSTYLLACCSRGVGEISIDLDDQE